MSEIDEVRVEIAALEIVLGEVVRTLCARTPDPTASLAEFGAALELHVDRLAELSVDTPTDTPRLSASAMRYLDISSNLHNVKETLLDMCRDGA